MSADTELVIAFPDLSNVEAGEESAALKETINENLREAGFPAAAQPRRVRAETTDFLPTVGVVVGPRATTAFFKGVAVAIQGYMVRRNLSRVEIQRSDGRTAIISNLESRDVAKVIAALQ